MANILADESGKVVGEVSGLNGGRIEYAKNKKHRFMIVYDFLLEEMLFMDGSHCKVLAYLMLNYSEVKSGFEIGPSTRALIAEGTALKDRTIYNTIRYFVKRNILMVNDVLMYRLSPRFSYRGSSYQRNSALVEISKDELNNK